MDHATYMRLLHSGRREWEALLSTINQQRMLQPGATGAWSVKDVIAHVLWCEREMVGVCQARALVGSRLWELTDDERNAIVVSNSREHTLQELLTEEREVYAHLLAEVQGLTDEDLNDARRFRDMPADWLPWQLLAGNSFAHYQDHLLPLSAWLAQQE